MDRRNFLKNLGLLGIIPLVPAWIDKEQFKERYKEKPPAMKKGGENLVLKVGDQIVGYTNTANIEMYRGRKSWNVEFENLQTIKTDNCQEVLDLLKGGGRLELKFSKGNYIVSGDGYFSELNMEAPFLESVNLSGKIEGDGALTRIGL